MSKLTDKLAGTSTKLADRQKPAADHPVQNDLPEGMLLKIDLADINPDPDQPRKNFDENHLQELAESIRQNGVLQPVIIRRGSDGKIWLVAGERRYRASKIANLDQIPAIVTKGNPSEIALIENIQREDLKPIEEAEAFDRMMREHSYTQEQLATIVGKARSTVAEVLTLNRLPEEIKEDCRRADTPKRVLIEIAKRENSKEMIKLYRQVKDGLLDGSTIRNITRKGADRDHNSPPQIALRKLQDFKKTIKRLDAASLNTEEHTVLWQEWNETYQLMNVLLNFPQQ